MIENEWMRFESTGSIEDYLAYSRAQAVYRMDQSGGSFISYVTGENSGRTKESENRDGAYHCAYRYDTGSNPHRGI